MSGAFSPPGESFTPIPRHFLPVLVMVFLSAACSKESLARRTATRGMALYDQGKYAEAMPLLKEATDAGRSEEHTSNSSHVRISYAVFCLKKKKTIIDKPIAKHRQTTILH